MSLFVILACFSFTFNPSALFDISKSIEASLCRLRVNNTDCFSQSQIELLSIDLIRCMLFSFHYGTRICFVVVRRSFPLHSSRQLIAYSKREVVTCETIALRDDTWCVTRKVWFYMWFVFYHWNTSRETQCMRKQNTNRVIPLDVVPENRPEGCFPRFRLGDRFWS